ncbi:MAG: hypothetical protein KIT00_01620 [Rhodospirillales bacterium]|nr:hypothetical protein [Rhodospirillales bacterium]
MMPFLPFTRHAPRQPLLYHRTEPGSDLSKAVGGAMAVVSHPSSATRHQERPLGTRARKTGKVPSVVIREGAPTRLWGVLMVFSPIPEMIAPT